MLAQGVEKRQVFNLIVRWRSLQDHAPGFEASEDHQVFMAGIQEYFSDEPTVYHLEGDAFAASDNDPLDPTV